MERGILTGTLERGRSGEDWDTCELSGAASEAVAGLEAAWANAGFEFTVRVENASGSQIRASIEWKEVREILRLAFEVLANLQWNACVDRSAGLCRMIAFKSEQGAYIALRIDLRARETSTVRRLYNLVGCVSPWCAPRIALVGPDGVGKSTVLNHIGAWFEHEAPFLPVTIRRWRPSLLPPLSRLLGKKENASPDESCLPRRKPGNLYLFRIAYYYLDFLLGSVLKDRRYLSMPRIIFYDRCAMDMFVDPVRFALRSPQGGRLIAKLSPGPQSTIFLTDDAERIYRRKQDLQQHEIREQLGIWRELANRGEVDAVIDVHASPQEVASCVLDVSLSSFVDHHERDGASNDKDAKSLKWIDSLLANGAARSRTVWRQAPNHNEKDELPSGHETRGFFVLPSKANPRFLIPDANGAITSNALGMYIAQTPFARLLRTLLTASLHAAPVRALLRKRASFHLTPEPEPHGESLLTHLAAIFGEQTFFSVSLGSPGPHRKPVIQVLNGAGKTLGYAKIGWDRESIQLVQNEKDVLRRFSNHLFSSAVLPSVLRAEAWREVYILVQSSAVEPVGTAPQTIQDSHIQFLCELHKFLPTTGELPQPELQQLTQVKQKGFHYYAHLMERARSFCSDRMGNAKIALGPVHGDFTPWNTKSCCDGLLVCDWEYATLSGPVAWDILHFFISTSILVRGETAAQIYRALMGHSPIREGIERYLDEVGVARETLPPLLVSYLATSLINHLLLHGVRIGSHDQRIRKTWAKLLNIAVHDNEPKARVFA